MKVVVLSENLQKKLQLVNHAISNRVQLSILSNLLVQAKESSLTISSTDLEIGIETKIPAEIEEEGELAIPAKLFTELINSLPAEKVSLVSKDNQIFIESKKTKSTLQTTDKNEFPILYEEKGENIFSMKDQDFKKEMKFIVFSASIESTRPALSGVLIKETEEGVVFVATDGYRLSLKTNKKTSIKNKEKSSLLIPARVIREALALPDEDKEMSIFVSPRNNQVMFNVSDTTIIGRLIEGEFPSYGKIIPTDSSTQVVFDAEELLHAVKTCAVFARESANVVKLSVQKDKIIVSAKTPSLGENSVEVEAKLTGEENEIAFNVRYLMDFLTAVKDEQVIFEMTGPLNAGVFKLQSDPTFLHLIMPIRT